MPSLPESPKAPQHLIELQSWFSKAVIEPDHPASSFKPDTFLNKSNKLSADQRLQIYMGDYWPRILDSLSEDFPLLYSFLGKKPFTSLMKDYLTHFPSTSFTLFHLGRHLLDYIRTYYTDKQKDLVLDIVSVEWARMHAYMAEDAPLFESNKLPPDQVSQLGHLSLKFHSSITLLHLDYPLLFHKPEDPFPSRKKQFGIIYRYKTTLKEQGLEPVHYQLLNCLKSKASLSESLSLLSKTLSSQDLSLLEDHIQPWFQEAASNGWFLHPDC